VHTQHANTAVVYTQDRCYINNINGHFRRLICKRVYKRVFIWFLILVYKRRITHGSLCWARFVDEEEPKARVPFRKRMQQLLLEQYFFPCRCPPQFLVHYLDVEPSQWRCGCAGRGGANATHRKLSIPTLFCHLRHRPDPPECRKEVSASTEPCYNAKNLPNEVKRLLGTPYCQA
jgi:hypothetical protein